ncbi:MAG: Hsp20/alpha crystallin family protein [Deltaproteobacteria bacterium]|nr:Hsp20/alpha crystallin family protein [Deltaproteobacteria bacterium]
MIMPIIFREPGVDPRRELEQLQRRMDRLFQGAFGLERSPWQVGVYPLVNISEDRDHIFVRAELPGVKAADLEITIQDNSLILRGQRQIPTEEKQVNYHRRERESGFFRRVMALPARIQADKVEATCKDGILTIKLAKPEEVKPRKIEVKVA